MNWNSTNNYQFIICIWKWHITNKTRLFILWNIFNSFLKVLAYWIGVICRWDVSPRPHHFLQHVAVMHGYLKKETSPFHKKFIGVCQITGDLSLECVVFEIMASALLPLLSVLSWRSCTTQTIERIRSGKSTKPKQNAHKSVPALDIQSLMNTLGFNEKKQKNIYLMRIIWGCIQTQDIWNAWQKFYR